MRIVVMVALVCGLLVGCSSEEEPAFTERSFVVTDINDLATDVAFSPDGSLLAASGTSDVLLWDVETGELSTRLSGHSHPSVSDATFSSQGLVASASVKDGTARVWDPETGDAIHIWEFSEPVAINVELQFSPDGSLLAISGSDIIRVWDLNTGELAHELTTNTLTGDMAFSPDGELLYIVTGDDRVLVINVTANEIVHELTLSPETNPSIALSPDGSTLAINTLGDQGFILQDTETWEEIGQLRSPMALRVEDAFRVRTPHFSPDGSMLVSSTSEGIIVWDLTTTEVIHTDPRQFNSAEAVFSPDSNQIAVAEFESGYTLWQRQP